MSRINAMSFVAVLLVASAVGAACPEIAFEPRIVHGSGGFEIASTADVNLDGRPDVSVRSEYSFGTFLTNPDGTLTTPGLVALTDARSLAIANIDAGPLPDAAVASETSVQMRSGNGDGTYTLEATVPVGFQANFVRAGDFNQDGAVDFLVTGGIPTRMVMLTQTAPWTFAATPVFPLGLEEQFQVEVTDLDADGRLDAVMLYRDHIDLHYGRGDGTFDPVVVVPIVLSEVFNFAFSLTITDLNGDGRLDLLAGETGAGVLVYLNAGGRVFAFERRIAQDVQAGARSVAHADVNLDGIRDLIISTYGGFLTLRGLTPLGSFAPPVFHEVPELSDGPVDGFRLVVADFRADGRPDVMGLSPVFFLGLIWATYPNACIPAPSIAAVTPDSGSVAGGTTVTITGTSLLTTTQVLFGSTPATILGTTGTTVTVQTPAGTLGPVGVTVTTDGGTASRPSAFTYRNATTTTVTTEPPVVIAGQPFRLVATISPAITGGEVAFMEGAALLGVAPVVNGRAAITITSPALAQRTVTANFTGTPLYLPSSGSTTFRALLAAGLTLQTSPAVPEVNEPYRVTLLLDPALNGGTVTFTDNGVVAGVVPVTNGTAFIDLVATEAGPRQIVAEFSGFGDYGPASATIALAVGFAIPTLSELALLAIAAMLAAAAALRLR